jgi:N-formylglutamate amidohydrolase
MSNVKYLVVLAFYTLLIVGGIHYYESRLKDLKAALEDYKRALNYAKGGYNTDHYTYLQLDNHALQVQVSKLKEENAYLRNKQPIQYESSEYEQNMWTE